MSETHPFDAFLLHGCVASHVESDTPTPSWSSGSKIDFWYKVSCLGVSPIGRVLRQVDQCTE